MRNSRTILAVLLSTLLASASATTNVQFSHGSTDYFIWSDDVHSLRLHSANGTGVVVDLSKPAPFHGLQAGDVILAIDNRHVVHVDDLLQALRDHDKSSATLQVRRAGAELALTWTYAEYRPLVPPPPPAPPPPPPAPAPAPPPPPPPPPPPHY